MSADLFIKWLYGLLLIYGFIGIILKCVKAIRCKKFSGDFTIFLLIYAVLFLTVVDVGLTQATKRWIFLLLIIIVIADVLYKLLDYIHSTLKTSGKRGRKWLFIRIAVSIIIASAFLILLHVPEALAKWEQGDVTGYFPVFRL